MINLIQGDCLEKMKEIESGSVDMILTDPPYGTTACKWDSIIPLEPMWEQLKRIIKPNRAVVLFGQEPFSSALRMSNIGNYKYDWYWKKARPSGFVNAKLKPLKDIEVISVFSDGSTANGSKKNMLYNPQGLIEVNKKWSRPKTYGTGEGVNPTRKSHKLDRVIKFENYPRQILEYKNHNGGSVHPTQKPVDLMEYLVKTYTNENETVLDFTMGSGSTGVACKNLNRAFIGIELDETYFNIAKERINNV
jgi:site-specific DNA-methyltransferase (adenine-specific)